MNTTPYIEGHMPKKLAKSEELVKVQRRLISALDRSKTSNSAEGKDETNGFR